MDNFIISERLKLIANFIPRGSRVADIGSDHALLPSFLVQNGIASFVIAGEVNEGPFQTAMNQIHSLNLENKVSVRKGNGLEVVSQNEIDVITIAGMGGALIAQILEDGKTKLNKIQRLILQPNVGEDIVRKWLDQHHWMLVDEMIIEENEKIYEIIVAEQKDYNNPELEKDVLCDLDKNDLLRLGPILWQRKSPLLLKKWKKEKMKIDYILKQIEQSKSEQLDKKQELKNEKLWLERVIKCLQKDSG